MGLIRHVLSQLTIRPLSCLSLQYTVSCNDYIKHGNKLPCVKILINSCYCSEREVSERQALSEAGLKESERLLDKVAKSSQKAEVLEEINICDVSRKICYLSVVCRARITV